MDAIVPPNPFDELLKEAQRLSDDDTREQIVSAIFQTSQAICKETVTYTKQEKLHETEKLDRIFTS